MKFPTIISGTAKDSDLSVMVGGVEKKGYDAYVIVDGSAKLFYKRAIEWTTEYSREGSLQFLDLGNSDTLTAVIEAENGASGVNSALLAVTYNFIGPLNLKAGQTINIYSRSTTSSRSYNKLSLDGDIIHTWNYTDGDYDEEEDYTYIMPADRTISSITATVWLEMSPYTYADVCLMAVTINSDYGSFLLNNSGTFNQ